LTGGPDRFARVAIVHSHGDGLSPDDGPPGDRWNRYDVLASLVEDRAGVRPKLVRTHHHPLEHCLELIMCVSGVDYVALADDAKRAILDGRHDLGPLVRRHVAENRESLRALHFGEALLDRADGHVAVMLDVLRRWRREMRALDAVVSATEREAREREAQLLPDHPGVSRCIPYGTSFEGPPPAALREWHRTYRDPGLPCFRGADPDWEHVRFDPGDRVVLFAGRPVREKGIFELAAAVRQLYHSFGNVRGVYLGDFDPSLRGALAASDPENARHYLFFAGFISDRDEIASLLAFADVLALPSYFETFPVVVLESLMMGTPCVVTEATSTADAYIERPGREGVSLALPVARLHPDDHRRYSGVDVDSLVRQLARLLDDRELARTRGADGKEYARRHFNCETMAAAHLRLYDDLLGA
jgi:glycosyltransferase involved in cell wall biosynthesis